MDGWLIDSMVGFEQSQVCELMLADAQVAPWRVRVRGCERASACARVRVSEMRVYVGTGERTAGRVYACACEQAGVCVRASGFMREQAGVRAGASERARVRTYERALL
jgi:hypothetical protein